MAYDPNQMINPNMNGYSSLMPRNNYGYGYNMNPNGYQNQASYGPVPQTNQMTVDWIQGGLNSAKAYPKPAPGCAVLLMDSDEDKFFIKKTDPSGYPLPLRIFNYKEEFPQQQSGDSMMGNRQSAVPDMSNYLTKEDFGKMLEEYLGPSKEKK